VYFLRLHSCRWNFLVKAPLFFYSCYLLPGRSGQRRANSVPLCRCDPSDLKPSSPALSFQGKQTNGSTHGMAMTGEQPGTGRAALPRLLCLPTAQLLAHAPSLSSVPILLPFPGLQVPLLRPVPSALSHALQLPELLRIP